MLQLSASLPIVLFAVTHLGCAVSAAENQRLNVELERAQVRALEGQLRLAELERRFVEVERAERTRAAEPSALRELTHLVGKLDVLIAQNQLMLSRPNEAAPPPSPESEEAPTQAAPSDCDVAADPKVRLLYWAQRLRGDSPQWRGGLSPAQSEALNVLLRPERTLDPSNPWRGR